MQDLTKNLAKISMRKLAQETADPLAVYLLREEMPRLQPGMKISAHAEPEQQGWNACLLIFDAVEGCCFYKHCLRKGCKSLYQAQLIAEYTQDKTSIDCPFTTQTPLQTKFSQN